MNIEKKSPYKFDTSLSCLQPGSVFKVPEYADYFMKTDNRHSIAIVAVNITDGHIVRFFDTTRVCRIQAKVVIE